VPADLRGFTARSRRRLECQDSQGQRLQRRQGQAGVGSPSYLHCGETTLPPRNSPTQPLSQAVSAAAAEASTLCVSLAERRAEERRRRRPRCLRWLEVHVGYCRSPISKGVSLPANEGATAQSRAGGLQGRQSG